jgi:pilus assembly protein CpaF
MLNALAGSIPGSERVISCEEVFEIKLPIPDWVSMQTRQAGLEGTGEVRLRDLVKETLRMRPSWVIVGEVRGEESLRHRGYDPRVASGRPPGRTRPPGRRTRRTRA